MPRPLIPIAFLVAIALCPSTSAQNSTDLPSVIVRILNAEREPIDGVKLKATYGTPDGYPTEEIQPNDAGEFPVTLKPKTNYLSLAASAPNHVPQVAT